MVYYYMNEFMNMRVGYAYVPIQKFGETYTPEEALKRGTLFPELDLPYGVYEGGLKDDR
jgi:hypothetical protein